MRRCQSTASGKRPSSARLIATVSARSTSRCDLEGGERELERSRAIAHRVVLARGQHAREQVREVAGPSATSRAPSRARGARRGRGPLAAAREPGAGGDRRSGIEPRGLAVVLRGGGGIVRLEQRAQRGVDAAVHVGAQIERQQARDRPRPRMPFRRATRAAAPIAGARRRCAARSPAPLRARSPLRR